MTFEMNKKDEKSNSQIGGSLKVLVKSIPGLDIEGQASLNITEDEKKIAKKMNFKYKGDRVIDPPPGTFEDAVKTYKQLSRFAKEKEKHVIVSFTLAPLNRYCDKSVTQILKDITDENIDKVGKMMNDFEEMDVHLKSLRRDQFTQNYPNYMNLIKTLEDKFASEKFSLTKKVQDILPRVRKSMADEKDLLSLVNDYKQSPFEKDKLKNLLRTREKEIEIIRAITDNKAYPNNVDKVVQGTGRAESCAMEKDFVLSYQIGVLPADPAQFVQDYVTANGILDESNKWFKDAAVIGKNKPLLDSFSKFAHENKEECCFTIRAINYEENREPFKLVLWKHGGILSDGFVPPTTVYKSEIIPGGRGVDSMKMITYHQNMTQLKPMLKAYVKAWESNATHIVIQEIKLGTTSTIISISNGLDMDTTYVIEYEIHLYEIDHFAEPIADCRSDTGCIGSGGRSRSFYVRTLPSTAPSNLKCLATSENSLHITWAKPDRIAPNVKINQFKYTTLTDNNANKNVGIIHKHELILERLIPATSYKFRVKYQGNDKRIKFGINEEYVMMVKMESPEAEVSCSTLPSKLTGLITSKIDFTEVTLSWNKHEELEPGSSLLYYQVRLAKLSHLKVDVKPIPEMKISPLEFKTRQNENFVATGLEKDESYLVSVRVVSTLGGSLYSDPIAIETKNFQDHDKNRLLEVEKNLVCKLISRHFFPKYNVCTSIMILLLSFLECIGREVQ